MIFTKSNFVKVGNFFPALPPPPAPPAGVVGRGKKIILLTKILNYNNQLLFFK